MNAYRDDLEAVQLRVLDLEREHAALQARATELESLLPGQPSTATQALPTKAPVDDLEAMQLRADELERANELLRARNRELEERIAAARTEDELKRARLAELRARERDEERAREQGEDEARLRPRRKVAAAAGGHDARYVVAMFALVGAIVAVASGSFAPMAMVVALAAAILVASLAG